MLYEVITNRYVSEFYDGDPPIALGSSAALAGRGVSGIAAILPFTCMPGTLIASVSDSRITSYNVCYTKLLRDHGTDTYIEKLTVMIDTAKVNTITVMMMEVPCCGGLVQMVRAALAGSSRKVPVKALIVSVEGNILKDEWI